MKEWVKEIKDYMDMKELVQWLNERTKEYDEGNPTVSDKEWDDKYFQLVMMEYYAGYQEANSPTQKISWDAVSALNKVKHNHPMLSLDKTKDVDEVKSFLGDKEYLAMAKMDGLTCSLKYNNGRLISAETRGNGEIGEDILHNANVIANIPLNIPLKDELIVDGEIICDLNTFKDFEKDYKNPRNFASGKIRSLDPMDCAKANLSFIAWDCISAISNTLVNKLMMLDILGFDVVPFSFNHSIFKDNLMEEIEWIRDTSKKKFYPLDGIVFKFNDCEYYESLGHTEHHFRGGLAFKFYDEEYETELLDIEWSMGRTGVLSPVAIFKPIDIDGTIVSRASLHNISIAHKTLGGHAFGWKGQKVFVYKANMIIPQISRAEEDNDLTKHYFNLPNVCPICGGNVEVRKEIDSEMLYCTNPQCDGKLVNKIDHFFGKKGLDAKGFSRATIQKIIDWGYVENISDCFKLDEHRADWIKRPGFGEKSVTSILTALDGCRNTSLNKIIAAAGIPLIGSTVSKSLAKRFKTYDEFRTATREVDFSTLDGFGYEMNSALHKFDYTELDYIVENFLTIEVEKAETEAVLPLEGLVFVITGKLSRKRDDIKADIEAKGGKVTGSVSSKTSYLVCNDKNSNTGKSKDAKALGIPIITEEELNALG